MEINFISQIFLRGIGRNANLMDNCLLEEDYSHILYQQLKNKIQSIFNGKKLDI